MKAAPPARIPANMVVVRACLVQARAAVSPNAGGEAGMGY